MDNVIRDKLVNRINSHNNNRIEYFEELISPKYLSEKLPVTTHIKDFVNKSRITIENILSKKDKRFLMIIGPCSIHNVDEAKEYADKLKILSDKFGKKIFVVMRVYFEKPRTTVGWKGLINDPDLNDSNDVNKGLFEARKLLIYLANIGVPAGCEMLDPITPQYISELISWGAIGARTTESQIHRQMVSGLSFPIGFKNGTNGDVEIAADAIISADHSHCFMGITEEGNPTICKTRGNPYTHIILRGGWMAPNYHDITIRSIEDTLNKRNIDPRIMVDCSHGNSQKNYRFQHFVFNDVIKQINNGNQSIFGLMLESNINCGKQSLPENRTELSLDEINEKLSYGVSVTDCCIDLEETEELLEHAFVKL